MIQTLIIEDEYRAADRLEKLLLKTNCNIQILEKLDSIAAAVNWFKNNPEPDLLFLDIQLADGLSFEIFRQVEVNCFIIFTTAYDEYAIKAFDLNSIDYLLKPIDESKLEKSLLKYHSFTSRNNPIDIDLVKGLLQPDQKIYKKRFVINIGNKIKTVKTNEIAWFISEERSTFLATNDGKQYAVDFSLDRLETLLPPEDFFRISRQFLVSFNSIINISVHSRSRIKLRLNPETEHEVLVSTSKSSKFREWLDK